MKRIFIFLLLSCFVIKTNAQAPRKVMVEDYTGMWCGWCPLGQTASEHLDSVFGNNVINIAMHDYDSLTCDYSMTLDSINNYGFPGAMVDRSVIGGEFMQGVGIVDPYGSDLDSIVAYRLSLMAPVAISISHTYNQSTRLLNVTLTGNFVAAESGDMRFSCVLVEDSIQTDNYQENYMEGNPGYPWDGMGSPIYFYTQRDVARINLASSAWGDSGIIPSSVISGSNYSKSYSYTIPSWWNENNIHIVGFISKWAYLYVADPFYADVDTGSVNILNADKKHLLGPTSIDTENNNVFIGNPFPNPFSESSSVIISLKKEELIQVNVTDVLGRTVRTLVDKIFSPGEHQIRWDGKDETGNGLNPGIYFCVLKSNSGKQTRRLVLVH